jgi:UDP-2,3-diacylglucosamine pyrophosphatase LpxH
VGTLKHISQVFESSEQIPFDDSSKFVLMSDCHRADGSWADNFSRNQNIYFNALTRYYNEGYTYIEIGDGDELWENNKFHDVINEHSDVFGLMSQFYNKGRLYFIYGNHDMQKKSHSFVKDNLYQYFNEQENRYVQLFPNVKVHEGLVLRHRITGGRILLIHGHQVDYFNNGAWVLTKFLNDYLWKPLELLGIKDITTRAAKNYEIRDRVEKRLIKWATEEKHILIAGHTHRPAFPKTGEPLYFNDGSCVHPSCITAIEIVDGSIKLVKWSVKAKDDGTLFIGKDIFAGPRKLEDCFKMK